MVKIISFPGDAFFELRDFLHLNNSYNLEDFLAFLLRLDRFYRAQDMKCESQERKKKEEEETLGENIFFAKNIFFHKF